MKAIFANFGRRTNVDRKDPSFEVASKTPLGTPSKEAPRVHAIYASLDTAASAIGDVPSTAPGSNRYRTDRLQHHSDAHTGPPNAWSARLSGSLRSASIRRKPLQAADTNDASARLKPASRSAHPPSSYKMPHSQPLDRGADSPALLRKTSTTSKRSAPKQVSSSLADRGLVSDSLDFPHVSGSDPSARSAAHLHVDVPSMSSADLAGRLDELAVANADGLLTDDEYRTLRQAVFDRMLQADKHLMSAPSDRDLSGSGLPDHVLGKPAPSPPNGSARHAHSSSDHLAVSRADSMRGQAERPGSSIRSGQSATSSSLQHASNFLKKSVGATKTHNHNGPSSGGFDASVTSDTARNGTLRRDSEGKSSQLSSGDGHSQRALSSRTQRSSGAKSSRLSTLGRLRAGSQSRRMHAETAARELEEAFSAERTARSLRAVSLYETGASEQSAMGGIARERSPTSLRAEMAPTTLFGFEYADKSSAEIQAEIAVVLGEGNRMLDTFAALEQTLVAKHGALEAQAVREVVERVREANPQACVHRFEASAPPPSSYRQPRQAHASSSGLGGEDGGASNEARALEAELTSNYAQRAAVVKRYQDRLAFLHSKARSAAMREGLK
ncbi:uncharacterized protein PAN0_012c4410 [Moesziomyces antarcticus]|uniref:Uncharacterized protein n=2 Tax=Pseudozyma antarctica TaxID=84753 RepID=A0A5C3FYG0_PSEA2|nr:uncharacterized protein PAN0_012c4410 [Moesziomyces antarcticus]GAK66188.1 conserved hypothetical protein [Moesziomyces antarcticus]SPO49270.1 uncharacterized protein PSANT_06961 [Moesziomyces antarcticus]